MGGVMLGAGRGFARRSGWRGAFVYAACLAVSGTLQEEASAASWTLERGSAQVITTFTYDIATAAFGNDGGLVPVPKFEKMNVGIHAEYGVLDNLTLRLLPSYEFVDTGFSGERNREQGLNSTGAGARYRLWSGSRQVISVESTYYTKGALRTNETTVLSR